MVSFAKFGDRISGIGGTDARIIASGDWSDLWEEKTGLRQSPNLDHIFKVQLGKHTEPLHAEWYIRQTGHQLTDPGNHPSLIIGVTPPEPFMFATFDRWIVPLECPLEMKHTHAGNNLEDCALFYMPQLQHQMMVAGVDRLIFSIIRGNEEPVHGTVSFDQDYCDKLLELERGFWDYVTRKERPPAIGVDTLKIAAAAVTIPINDRRPYDYTTNNEWVSKAGEYQQLKPQADRFKEVDKELRALIPADASLVEGGGLILKRDARGAFRCTITDTAQPASLGLSESTEA